MLFTRAAVIVGVLYVCGGTRTVLDHVELADDLVHKENTKTFGKFGKGGKGGNWDKVRSKISQSALMWIGLSVTAGDASSQKFSFGNTLMPMDGRSFSKWSSATAIAGAVKAGKMKFDTRANELFKWWTTDPKDARSRVTLRHLLTMTAGFRGPSDGLLMLKSVGALKEGLKAPCVLPTIGGFTWVEVCAKQIYSNTRHESEPGKVWQYNMVDMQIALAMATKATGYPPFLLYSKYLNWDGGMLFSGQNSAIQPAINPHASGGLITCGHDVDAFLRRYLGYKMLAKATIDEMDKTFVSPALGVQVHPDTNWPQGQQWAMGHESGRKGLFIFDFPYDVQSLRSGGRLLFIDRTAGIYAMQMVATDPGQIDDAKLPLLQVLPDIYAAMGKKWPR